MPETSPTLLIDGAVDGVVDARDRGLAFGDGLFETTAVIDGRVRFVERHLGRLAEGCRRLGFAPPPHEQLANEMAQLAAGHSRAVIKVIVTRGSGGVGYAPPVDCRPTRIVQRLAWRQRPDSDYRNGIRVGLCRCRVARQPALAGLKHLNRLEQVLARAEMADTGMAEGLMLDEHDHVIEATAGNLFVVIDDVLVTPRLDISGVRGIMRAVVLETAEALGIAVRRVRLELPALLDAQEVFLSNALAGLMPVSEVVFAGSSVRVPPGPKAAALSAALQGAGIAACGAG